MEGKTSITVNVNYSVDDETARLALSLVEIYLNSHSVKLVQSRTETGEVTLFYAPDCPMGEYSPSSGESR